MSGERRVTRGGRDDTDQPRLRASQPPAQPGQRQAAERRQGPQSERGGQDQDDSSSNGPLTLESPQDVFPETVREGEARLGRSLPSLLATGAVGGMDVGTGVLALLLVLTLTHSEAAGAIAFGFGFIALNLGNSELFTENFLVPIMPIVARSHRRGVGVLALLRLWVGTLAMNLVGGWLITFVIVVALPQVKPEAIALGQHFVSVGISTTSFASAVLGGGIITLMTWMQRGTQSPIAKLVAAEGAGFLLAAGHLNHAIVASLEMFAALHAGATFGYLTWFKLLGWAVLGNVIGGLFFVTALRLVQVGAGTIRKEGARAERERPDVDL